MKRCPDCRRDYYDETLLYCLDDGSALLDGPAHIHSTAAPSFEPATVMLHSTQPPDAEPATRVFDPGVTGGRDNSNAVAVLPFANLSRNEDNEYFSDGLAEELLNVLSKIKGLRVAARTSAFVFKGKQVSIAEIGKALNVQSVVEGSVRLAGQRVRIAVQLVNVENGYHLWSETYDRTMDDIFAIQDDIAHSVVAELREIFLREGSDPAGREKVADEVADAIKGRAADPEAQRLMLLGRYLLDRVNEDNVTRAIGYFRQALDIDPDYAQCWCELGRAFGAASAYGWTALDNNYQLSIDAIQTAVDLEPGLAEAHALLAGTRWYRDVDPVASEQCLERALDLAPDNINVLMASAIVAGHLGQFKKSLDHCRRAAAIDPLSPRPWSTALQCSFALGDLKEAELAGRRSLELAPQRINTHAYLALVLMRQGRRVEALAEALLEPEKSVWRAWSLTIIYHDAGRFAESDAELANLVADVGSTGATYQVAEAHSMRGETDEAFNWLERSIEERDPGRTNTKISSLLKPLHDDPRWLPLLRKIGFPE